MDIYSIGANLPNFFSEGVLGRLTPQQKKTAGIVFGILSCFALAYYLYHSQNLKGFFSNSTEETNRKREGMEEPPNYSALIPFCSPRKVQEGALSPVRQKRLHIMGINGDKWEIFILLKDTVLQLKEKICEQSHIPTDRQRLIYRKTQLTDWATLEDCQIHYGSKIHLFLKLSNH